MAAHDTAGPGAAKRALTPVLMVAYQYPPEGGSSGVLRTLKFSKYLPAMGYAPHILTLKESLYRTRDESLCGDIPPEATVHRTLALDSSRHLAVRGRHLAMLAVPDPHVSWLPFGAWRGLRVVRRERVRCLFSTSPPPTTHLIAGVLRRLTRVPWVADLRDPWIEEGIYPRPGSLRERVERRLERWVLRTADRVVVTTPRLREEILRRHPNLSGERVRVIYNGYDESDFPSGPAPRAAGRFEILHAGLVTPEFRDPWPLLEEVAGLLRDGTLPADRTRVTLLGGGGYVAARAFHAGIRGLGLDGVVRIEDRVPHAEALEMQRRAAVLLLLQASDDTRALIPAKAFEYLRLGRPILALVLEGDTADLLKGMEHCQVVDPADRPALRRAVVELYGQWRDGGGAGPRRAIEQYERRRLTARLAGIFDELIAPA